MIFEINPIYKSYVMSWEDYEDHIQNLIKKIEAAYFIPEIIVGIFQGGWIVGQSLLDYFPDARMVGCQVNYNDKIPSPLYFVTDERKGQFHSFVSDKKILIVDEVIDSGRTLSFFKEDILSLGSNQVKVASFYHFEHSKLFPDFSVRKLSDPLNIVFPWRFRRDIDTLIYNVLQETPITIEALARLLHTTFGYNFPLQTVELGVSRLNSQNALFREGGSVRKKM
ncbi:phosphoribosyltransferase [Paenibacillus sp. GCM10012307]|uniref:Phosphoribosyltransferase domain-containing protein n=1 Tax=Paenibacillus roseus TaxID=2798579 RepID=A0A934MPM6_9BACL|nr:phosphoribosyltransferase family protein [Paenibacillus roseus]MBJ6360564.1 hypothetical protein [Paenibacillus roseus]